MSFYDDIFGGSSNRTAINSKNKGNTNERECARQLTAWTGEKFCRVPSSGGLRWKDSTRTAADIMCEVPDFYFPLTVETKALAVITIKPVLSESSALFKIWDQVVTDADRCSKLPFAMLRSNGMPKGEYYCIMEYSKGGSILSLCVRKKFVGSNAPYNLIGFMFSDVMKYMPYPKFAKMLKKSNFVPKSKVYVQQ